MTKPWIREICLLNTIMFNRAMAIEYTIYCNYNLKNLFTYTIISVILLHISSANIDIIRSETSVNQYTQDGVLRVNTGVINKFRLFGKDLSNGQRILMTSNYNCGNEDKYLFFNLYDANTDGTNAFVNIIFQRTHAVKVYTMCMKTKNMSSPSNLTDESNNKMIMVNQGNSPWQRIHVKIPDKTDEHTTFLPLWLQILVIIFLLFLSGLFSGLNLGLMSLDKTELQIVENCGSEQEKRFAKVIAPVRKKGNFLLCTILLGNVLVNNSLTILLDNLSGNGMVAIIGATLAIVIFGEIIPQAVCSRHGLEIGARTIWIVRIVQFLTFPLSFPISKLLDMILGEEMGNTYNRVRLRELLKVTEGKTDLVNDELKIITGALDLSKKTVGDIMTDLKDVYMLDQEMILDFNTVSDIMKSGYTRIPVFENDRYHIVHLMNIKDLAFIDPDDKTPLRSVLKFYNHNLNFVFDGVKLNVQLEEFKKGKFHMSIVQKVNNSGPGDPFYQNVGVVTLEDIIEEIIQAEIMDETDTIMDNRGRAPRKQAYRDFSVFNTRDEYNYPRMSSQLLLATFQFLSTSCPPFMPDKLSDTILRRLLQKNILYTYKIKMDLREDKDAFLYNKDESSDYFILILQGHVQVNIGAENMNFDCGQFMFFGVQALIGPTIEDSQSENTRDSADTAVTSAPAVTPTVTVAAVQQTVNTLALALAKRTSLESNVIGYTPDYTVRAISDLEYLKIDKNTYVRAVQATKYENESKTAPHMGSMASGLSNKNDSLEHQDDEDDGFFNPSIIHPASHHSRDSASKRSVATGGHVHFNTDNDNTDNDDVVLDIETSSGGSNSASPRLSVNINAAPSSTLDKGNIDHPPSLPSPQDADAPLLKKQTSNKKTT